MELKLTWIKLLSGFEINSNEQEKLWLEIVKNYSGKNRHYHNLSHLDKMITELNQYENLLQKKEEILLSIFYHDLIYKPLRKDNEKQSAEIMLSLIHI